MPRILTIPRDRLPALPLQGVWPAVDLDWLGAGEWRERAQAEHDESRLQPIVYLALRDAAGALWCYSRVGGDARLHGRWSCGLGGHVDMEDSDQTGTILATHARALRRELIEELGSAALSQLPALPLRPQALIYEGHSPVGRVHIGLLYCAQWIGAAAPRPMHGEALEALGFRTTKQIVDDQRFELWSRLAAGWIGEQP